MVSYLAYFWAPANSTFPRALIITGVVLSLTALNVFGVRQAAIASNLFTVGKLIPMLICVAAGRFFSKPKTFPVVARSASGPIRHSALLASSSFTAVDIAANPADE